MDKSNGYEEIAATFISARGTLHDVGTSSVRRWASMLPTAATVLDLGCGTGVPVTRTLMEEGITVYGIDASPTLVNAFRKNFPHAPIACEAAEDSTFFNRKFDGIIAWGLMFLLGEEPQELVIRKAAKALKSGGEFLFTAPYQQAEWRDLMTGRLSKSLGSQRYRELLSAAGLFVAEEFQDEGENHYYRATTK
mgnify:CR=1 FL=1|jgi:2-polyprenyl-3-methyl-5-hydroxy-6-metoxy-1,4-benzoquinol methylase